MKEKIENNLLSIEVDHSGAELWSVFDKTAQKEYLWSGNGAWWSRRAPVLFPIVGKLNGNTYTFKGQKYDLPQHGFARDLEFLLIEKNKNRLVFALHSNKSTLSIFPFEFELQISYELVANKLIVTYEVKNTGTQDMYFSIGAHPGFNCPLNPDETFSDYFLEFEKQETFDRHLLDEGLFNGKTERLMTAEKILELKEELFQKDAIVFKDIRSSFVTLRSHNSSTSLKIECKDFPYFGIWTKPGAPFICLEPWCGMADNKGFKGELQEKEGIVCLGAKKNFMRSFSMEIGRGMNS